MVVLMEVANNLPYRESNDCEVYGPGLMRACVCVRVQFKRGSMLTELMWGHRGAPAKAQNKLEVQSERAAQWT